MKAHMAFRLKVLIGLVTALAAASAVYLFVFTSDATDDKPDPIAMGVDQVDNLDDTDHSREQPDASVHAPLTPMAMLNTASKMSEIEGELLLRARGGDTAAMAVVVELTSLCTQFSPMFGDEFHPRHEVAKLPAGSTERASKEKALAALVAFCDRQYGPGEAIQLVKEFSTRLSEAAAKGDITARAYNLFPEENEASVLNALQESKDPWLAERAMNAFFIKNGPVAKQLDSEVFPSHMLAVSPAEAMHIRSMAARWRGCELGAACGPNHHNELGQCLYLGNCGLGLSRQAYIQQRELSAYQFELMQKYLAAFDTQIKRGR
jgi:hypothetical protein